MEYPNALSYFAGQFWAIRPETLDTMADVLAMRANGVELSKEEIEARISGGPGRGMPNAVGSIMVLPLCGVIDQKVNSMTLISGGTSVNAFMEAFRAAVNDKTVSAIVFDVDSPGGNVSGIAEAANEIYAARGKKPIIAVADPQIASAAYWLACGADEIVCMPSGMVGSIGVLTVHRDLSKANEMAGYNPTYITYGQYKAERNPDTPLSADAQEYMQSQVNQMGDMFVKFVAKARGVSVETVRSSFGQGRMLMAKDAQAAGMIDSIGTLDQTIQKLSKGTPTTAMTLAMEDDMECDCECGDGCTCNGDNDTCCGMPDCDCCSDSGKQVSMGDAMNNALVGLRDIATRVGDLVDRGLTNGKQPGAVLTKAKTEALLDFQAGVRDAQTIIDAVVQKAGIEPKAESDDTTLALEIARLEYLDTRRRRG